MHTFPSKIVTYSILSVCEDSPSQYQCILSVNNYRYSSLSVQRKHFRFIISHYTDPAVQLIRQRWAHCMKKQKLNMKKNIYCYYVFTHVCLTSTTTDTAALTKMMRKSFTLHSNGTQTICGKRDTPTLTIKVVTLKIYLWLLPREACFNVMCVCNTTVRRILLMDYKNITNMLHIFNVLLPLETRRCLRQDGTWWTAGKNTKST